MNRKVLVIAVALMAVTMLMPPLSAVSAKKAEPTTMTLQGMFAMLGFHEDTISREFAAGESGNYMFKWKVLPVGWDAHPLLPPTTPHIKAGTLVPPPNHEQSTPGGYAHSNWVQHDGEFVGTVWITVLADAEITGITGTGNLKIRQKSETMEIISGTGAFRGIKGTGTYQQFLMPGVFSYTLEVQIP